MRSAEEYRSNAVECMALAKRQADPHSGYVLRGVADSWLWLAEQAERDARRDKPRTKQAA